MSVSLKSSAAETVPFPDETRELRIGTRIVGSRYFLAPLAGYTHLAFRTALRELGGMGLATTDLVHATHLLSGKRRSLDLIATTKADNPLSVQIFSGRGEELVAAARWLEDHGYRGIDINMGCPMAKINGQGGGARLMCDVAGACRVAADVVAAVSVPVTVKMRIGWDRSTISAPRLARELEQAGVSGITVHGRTRQQGFCGSVDLGAIRDTVEAVQNIPIIGNGDVLSVQDAFRMRGQTGCAAVAIGRGAMLDPWIFHKIDRAVRGDDAPFEPSAKDQIRFLVRHFTLMTRQHGDYSCTLFRKFAGWYGARLGIPEDLEDRLRRFSSRTEFEEIVVQIRRRHGERVSAIPTAHVKVPNGPIEHW